MHQSLRRFEDAQNDTYEAALHELRLGEKQGHWMWFVFPQLRGLGRSHNSRHYGISDLTEAENYLLHPVLGPRLVECTRVVLSHEHRLLTQIFPKPDDLKFASCMTLFSAVANTPPEFRKAIDKFLGGKCDKETIRLLRSKQ